MKVGYARVSSKNQADTDALNQQVERLRKAGAEEILTDIQSGREDSRKNYKQLLKLVKASAVTEVITTRLDRLGRNAIEIHRAIELFREHSVKFTNLDMPLDGSGSAMEWLTIQNIASMAEFESRSISDRVRHGLNYYRENLKAFKPPFGYTKDENLKLIPHPVNWDIARELCERLRSQTKTKISRWLADKHGVKMYPTSFRRYILNPCLRGHTVYKVDGEEKIHYNTHPALLSEVEYQELEQTTRLKTRRDTSKYKLHFLAGLFRCGVCGAAMSKSGANSPQSKNVLRFQCAAYKAFGLKSCTNKKTIAASIVKREVIGELRLYAIMITRDIELLATERNEDDPELLQLQQQINGLKKLGDNPAIAFAIADLEKQIRNREHHQNVRGSTIKEDKKILYALLQADFLESLPDEELRSICIRFISSVKYSGGKELNISMRALV
ncbi:recombinase family protein [Plectonema cf. radiosum LEGE 06105]|uniref:Recombinase family protein n=1 Tax=Plectonema cf. radiosum LEGE 06105 TaxID=945769 RepID=A0A8J7F407_9CYAN|nr:fdxN element excision recombinase XisF [Plectonema radiosum]MBE9212960.1 recombinase family protein [Plectonema cf. radiosum LEGE 06105]